ncbi:MAG: zinc ABC transporter substrate-binding protein [Dehalococcoidia bacterium]|nr:zinc ABC transporter substrate-binding protein [Dehalococcoidia bacterium]
MRGRRFGRARGAMCLTLLAIVALFIGAGCGAGGNAPASPDVVATTAVVGALAKAVAGDTLTVWAIVGPGVDPHEYEASPADVTKIRKARVVLRNGIGIDAFLDRIIVGSGQQAVVTVTEGIKLRQSEDENGKREDDPHVWHNAANAKIMIDDIVRALTAAFPEKSDAFAKNAAAYEATLDAADVEIKKLIDGIPPANRKLVTNHDALGYFIDHYGLIYVGAVIPGLSTEGEPSAQEIASLEDLIRREGVKAIFAESSVEPRVARQIAKDTKIKIVDDLYGDSLGKPGTEADTVDKMLLVNARKIARALQ